MRKWSWIPLLAAAFCLLLLPALPSHAAERSARVRVVHASPDAPAVDIYLNGKAAARNLAYTKATPYLSVKPGTYRVQVTPAGADPGRAVIDAKVMLDPGKTYTVAAIGQLATIRPLVLQDDLTPPAAGKAHLRVVHASPDAPPVDVAVTGGPVLIRNLSFGSGSAYLPVDAGTYNLEVRAAGTDNAVLKIPGFQAQQGAIYTVFAMGRTADNSLRAVPLVDAQPK